MPSVSAILTGSNLQIGIDDSSTGYLCSQNGQIEIDDDPSFLDPLLFNASSVAAVTVTGDAGNDALAVTAGTIAASLSTSLVADVSFSPAAAFSGPVSVDIAAGVLNVTGIASTASSIAVTASSGLIDVSGPLNAAAGVTLGATTGAVLISAAGDISSGGAVTITGPGGITTGGNVAAAGGVTYNSPLILTGPVAVATTNTASGGSGPIRFEGTIDGTPSGSADLTLSAGSDPVTFSAAVGSRVPLGSLSIVSADGVVARGPIQLDGATPGAGLNGLTIGANVDSVDFVAAGSVIQRFAASGLVFQGQSTGSTISGFTIQANVYDGIQLAPADYSGTIITGNTVVGNIAFGLEALGAVTHLTFSRNEVGASGSPNNQGIVFAPGIDTGTTITGNTILDNAVNGIVTSGTVASLLIGRNTIAGNGSDGVQLAAGADTGTSITGNTITGNQGYGIHLTGAVTGLLISANAIGTQGAPNGNGVGVAGGTDTGTSIVANRIEDNTTDGVALGVGVPQAASRGNPLQGYADYRTHYILPYAFDPGFGTNDLGPLAVNLTVAGTTMTVAVDTGSRGLFISADQLPANIDLNGPPGQVYLNSSNLVFKGTFSRQQVTFPGATYYVNGTAEPGTPATANMLVLVVTAVGASTTPAPGETVAKAKFFTTVPSGTVTITNGASTEAAPITPDGSGAGYFTIPGGYWATYAANPGILSPATNLGVGFDRTGQGTTPDNNEYNQQYNAFLNIIQMQQGSMRAGFIITPAGVQLGLDNTVSGYAYTSLTPTGLSQVAGSPPDWQAPTGTLSYEGQNYDTGQVVIDSGFLGGILTLPGSTSESSFSGSLGVDLINSDGSVGYQINTADDNILAPTRVSFFNPLSGNFTENLPTASGQFFNAGINVLNEFNYLYDADGGYLGLVPNNSNPPASAQVAFTPAYYPNPLTQPTAPGPVTGLTIGGAGVLANVIQNNASDGIDLGAVAFTRTVISGNLIRNNGGDGVRILGSGAIVGGAEVSSGNTITGNTGDGVRVLGATAVGDAILSNSIFQNGGLGIDLTDGGNAGQLAPSLLSITAQARGTTTPGLLAITLSGTMPFAPGYGGLYRVEFFGNPASDARGGGFEGRTLLGAIAIPSGRFSVTFAAPPVSLGDWITATATPASIEANTSMFSPALHVMTLLVSTAADYGPGSLRAAIKQANLGPGLVYIDFDLPRQRPTIKLKSALPALTEPVVIDGGSQPGYVGSPLVTIAGGRVPGNASGITIGAGAAGSAIIDLAIDDFRRGSGVRVSAVNVTVRGDLMADDRVGLSLIGASGAEATGNTITNSRDRGIYAGGILAGAEVQGNLIQASGHVGVVLDKARDLMFGGPNPGSGNVIRMGSRWPSWKYCQAGLLAAGKSTGTFVQGNTFAVRQGRAIRLRRAIGITVVGNTVIRAQSCFGGDASRQIPTARAAPTPEAHDDARGVDDVEVGSRGVDRDVIIGLPWASHLCSPLRSRLIDENQVVSIRASGVLRFRGDVEPRARPGGPSPARDFVIATGEVRRAVRGRGGPGRPAAR